MNEIKKKDKNQEDSLFFPELGDQVDMSPQVKQTPEQKQIK